MALRQSNTNTESRAPRWLQALCTLICTLCLGAHAGSTPQQHAHITLDTINNEALEELAYLHRSEGSAIVQYHLNRQWLASHEDNYKHPSFGRVMRKYLKRQLAPYIDSTRLKLNTESKDGEYQTPEQQRYQLKQNREFNTTYYDLDVKEDEVEFEVIYRF